MKTRLAAAVGILLFVGAPASAHRLDEYLQATTISVEKDRVQAQIRLTPGVTVLPLVLAKIIPMRTESSQKPSNGLTRSACLAICRSRLMAIDCSSGWSR